MNNRVESGRNSKKETLISTTNNRELWRAMIAQVLKGYGTYKIIKKNLTGSHVKQQLKKKKMMEFVFFFF